jgi:predicted Zn-dependent protease
MHRISHLILILSILAPGSVAAGQETSESILVVPFENRQNDPTHHWMGEAAAVLVSDSLRARGVNAIARAERAQAFEQLHLPLTASLSRATIIKVGRLVGAAEVVVGSFSIEGDAITVKAHGIGVDAGKLKPEILERGPLTDLFAIFERVSRRLSPDAPRRDPPAPAHPPLDAFEHFIKGLVAESPVAQVTFLETAIREHPGFDRARLALWEVRAEQGDHEAALAVVNAVPPASPYARRARFAAGVSLLELEQVAEAFGTFTALLEDGQATAPGSAPILNNLGVVQIRRGPTLGAGTSAYYLTKAVDADPDPDFMFNLGYSYVLDRNFQGGVYWLREMLRRDPADADAHWVLASALQNTGNAVEADRERDLAGQLSARYETLSKRSTDGRIAVPQGLERIQMVLEVPRHTAVDKALIDTAQREQRDRAAFHLDRGRRLYQREQDSEAMAELRRAVYLSPYEAEAHLLIGQIHLRAGRPTDAIEALKISIWSAESVGARVALAEAYLKSGDSSAARAEIDRVLALDPYSPDAKRLLAQIR